MQAMSPWVFIYFILIVVLGGFFVINLFLAVIFEETISAQLNEEMLGAAVRLAGRFNDEQRRWMEAHEAVPTADASLMRTLGVLRPA